MAEAKGVKPESNTSSAPAAPRDPTPAADAHSPPPVKFKNLWPIPALALGAVLFIAGFVQFILLQPKPPPDIALEQAKALVADNRYQEAIDKLNSKDVRNFLDYGEPSEAHLRAFHLARARAFAGAQSARAINRPENHRAIADNFLKAEKHGDHADLTPTDVSLLVDSLIALDEIDSDQGALKRIESLPEAEAPRRTRLIRRLVEHDLARSADRPDPKRSERTLDLLGRLASDPALPPADKAWVLARQGEMLLAAGKPEEAINKLIRRVGLLKDVPDDIQGELYVLLGKAYFQSDQPVSAVRQLEAADALLPKASPLRADLGIMQGRLAQSGVAVDGGPGATDNEPSRLLELAREKFEGVILDFGASRSYARAVLGVAEVEAALRHDDKSLERYSELAEMIRSAAPPKSAASRAAPARDAKPDHAPAATESHAAKPADSPAADRAHADPKSADPKPADAHAAAPPAPTAKPDPHAPLALATDTHAGSKIKPRDLGDVTRDRVTTSLVQRFHERFGSGQRDSALRYATMAESLFPDPHVPAEVLLAIGRTRRAMGDHLMEQARESHAQAAASGVVGADFSVSDLDPTTRAEVRQNYVLAGDYLRRHAKAIAGEDLAAASESLWTAADSYDRAGDMDEARKAFTDYAASASDTDKNRPAAKFRLAQVYQAQSEFASAEAIYRTLVAARDAIDPTRSAGPWSDAAIVPLAQCLLADADPANDEEAERLLLGVLDGSSTMTPDAPAYRDALVELGASYYRREQFARAIGWLEQASKRYKDDRRIESTRYLLADSHRREGVAVARTLAAQRLPQSDRDKLEADRIAHLRSAASLYDSVRLALEAKDPRTLTALEKIHLKNAYFYLGDCLLELRDYPAAIAACDAARQKYADDPAALIAMSQIVSAYIAQEKWAEARTANERARQQLARFPETVWQDPNLPMEKRHWEKWLDDRRLLDQQATPGTE